MSLNAAYLHDIPHALPPSSAASQNELNSILERVLQGVLDAVGAQKGFVYLYTSTWNEFQPLLSAGKISLSLLKAFQHTGLHGQSDPLAREVLSTRLPVVSLHSQSDPRIHPSAICLLSLTSLLALPVQHNHQVLGLIIAGDLEKASGLSELQLRQAETIVSAAALALDNVRLYQETRQRLEESQSLHQITLALLQKLNLQEVLEIVCAEAQRLTQAAGSSVSLVEEEHWLRIAHLSGKTAHLENRFQINDSLLGLAVRRGETILINTPPVPNGPEDDPNSFTLLAVPLQVKDQIIGVLDVVGKRPGFTPDDVRLIERYANQAAIAIEHARLYEQVEQISILEERQRLARELHDSVNQSLYAVALYSEAVSRYLGAGNIPAAESHLTNLRTSIKDALGEMRLLIFGLRPPVLEKMGLAYAIQARLKSVEERAGLKTGFKGRVLGRLPIEIEDALYGITQEALNNVLKHAQASSIKIHLIQSGRTLLLKIEDDGIGFDPQQLSGGSLGVRTMQERADTIGARFTIKSQPGNGTTVLVEMVQ